MLEQVLPDCVVEGAHDLSADESEESLPPRFVQQYDQLAGFKDREKAFLLAENKRLSQILDKRT